MNARRRGQIIGLKRCSTARKNFQIAKEISWVAKENSEGLAHSWKLSLEHGNGYQWQQYTPQWHFSFMFSPLHHMWSSVTKHSLFMHTHCTVIAVIKSTWCSLQSYSVESPQSLMLRTLSQKLFSDFPRSVSTLKHYIFSGAW